MFLLKVVNKIATGQLQRLLEENNILHPRQSGFQPGYSTETALLDLQSHMREIIDRGAGMLVLLDLSAAFDLFDHNILMKRLTENPLFSSEAIKWIASFLADRTAVVTWARKKSGEEKLLCSD